MSDLDMMKYVLTMAELSHAGKFDDVEQIIAPKEVCEYMQKLVGAVAKLTPKQEGETPNEA